jgi:hypothetical protein
VREQLQSRLDEQVKAYFPDGGVQRVALLQHGDDPSVEPGDLLVRVFIEEAQEAPPLRAWDRDHETMTRPTPGSQLGDLVSDVRSLQVGPAHDSGDNCWPAGRTDSRTGASPMNTGK